jgi:hypothetical protein
MFLHALHLDGLQRTLWFGQLFLEAIGRTVSFQWAFLRSIKLFFRDYPKIRAIRKSFADKNRYSVKEVARLIKEEIKGKQIRRF